MRKLFINLLSVFSFLFLSINSYSQTLISQNFYQANLDKSFFAMQDLDEQNSQDNFSICNNCIISDSTNSIVSNRYQTIEDENFLILQPVLNAETNLGEVIEVYVDNSSNIFLPISELFLYLSFPIKYDSIKENAQGWFLNEKNKFFLDYKKNTVKIKEEEFYYPPNKAFKYNNELYVESGIFAEWFSFLININYSKLELDIGSNAKLPIELYKQRKALREKIQTANSKTKQDFPKIDTKYKAFSSPFIDVSANSDLNKSGETSDEDINYSAIARNDLLFFNSSSFISGNKTNGIESVRFLGERKDADNEMFGALNIGEIYVGDISSVEYPLVNNVNTGRGIRIGKLRNNKTDQFDKVTITGFILDGWEVELYRNGILIDFIVPNQLSNLSNSRIENGQYKFSNVALNFGENIFKIVQYGPQGQIKENIKTYNINSANLKPGAFDYAISVDQPDKLLFSGVNESDSNNIDLTDDSKYRLSSEFSYGLTKNITSNFSHIMLPDDNQIFEYSNIGSNFNIGKILAETNLNLDHENRGAAYETSISTNIFEINLDLDFVKYDNFKTDPTSSDSARLVSQKSSFNISGNIKNKILKSFFYNLKLEETDYDNEDKEIDFSPKISFSIQDFRIDNNINFSELENNQVKSKIANGVFAARKSLGRFSYIRARLDYDIEPKAKFRFFSVTFNRKLSRETNFNLTFNQDIENSEENSFTGNFNKNFDKTRLGLNFSFSDDDQYSIGLNFAFTIGKDPEKFKPKLYKPGSTNGGVVLASAYLDDNSNNQFDKNEKIVRNVDFLKNSQKYKSSGENAVITNLVANQENDITLDLTSLNDPTLLPVSHGYSVVTHPAKFTKIYFPLASMGEIDGTVYFVKDKEFREAKNILIKLVNIKGEIIKELRSEFDGFFLFTEVPYGKYELVIEEDKKRGVIDTVKKVVEINSKEHFLSEINFYITESPK